MKTSNVSLKSLFRRLFAPVHQVMSNFESPRYLLRWVVISTLIGIVAGIGAIAFCAAIHLTTSFFLDGLVGYRPPDPAGEGPAGVMSFWAAARPWLLPVITTLGGLVAGIIVFTLAPEAEGHGTDAAIAALHQGKLIRARIPLIKLVASAITIGTGGSAGREGPAAQISAGFGSILATLLKLDSRDRRIALATGIGAGVGAIFRAPLGGAILAVEIVYIHDLEVEAIIPALIASIVGYSIFGAWSGWNPIFAPPGNLTFSSPLQLLYYVVLGLLCGGMGLLYARGFYGITHLFRRLHLPSFLKPALGGLLVGLMGLVIPQVLGTGYGWVQVSMGKGLLGLPLWVILALPVAKIVTTGLSIGSGGSGGIFGPGMVIGGMTGALLWRLCYHIVPGLPDTPGPFVIVGMMALFGGIAHAPIAMMVMVAEMTGNLSLMAPAMIAVSLAYLIVGKSTIYSSQLETRADSPAHRLEFSFPLLASLTVRQAMIVCGGTLRQTQSIIEAAAVLAMHDGVHGALVLGDQDELLGTLTKADIEQVPERQREQRTVGEAMTRQVQVLHEASSLDTALEELTTRQVSWAPVIASGNGASGQRVVGVLTLSQIVQVYRQATAEIHTRASETRDTCP